MNFLEELAKEWYEYQGFWVRTNVKVDHQEMDVLAYNGETRQLVHIETGKDALSWAEFERRLRKKFSFTHERYEDVLRSRISKVVKIAVAGWAVKSQRVWKTRVDDIEVVRLREFVARIASELAGKIEPAQKWIPESYPLLHTIQWLQWSGDVLKERSLEELLAGVTPSNLHEEVDWGPVRGGEAW